MEPMDTLILVSGNGVRETYVPPHVETRDQFEDYSWLLCT